MKEAVIETCEYEHKFYKEGPDKAKCPHCMAIGLDFVREENEKLGVENERLKEKLNKMEKLSTLDYIRKLEQFSWVWCKDEMPEPNTKWFYQVRLGENAKGTFQYALWMEYLSDGLWRHVNGETNDCVTRWLRAPEPTEEPK